MTLASGPHLTQGCGSCIQMRTTRDVDLTTTTSAVAAPETVPAAATQPLVKGPRARVFAVPSKVVGRPIRFRLQLNAILDVSLPVDLRR